MHAPEAVADWLRARVSTTLRCDSRRVGAGDGFVAWPGAATDGRRYVAGALEAGATAAVVERDGVEAFSLDSERVVAVPGLKQLAGPIASAFHGDPSAALDVVAVTGTNGKTSCAWWMAQTLTAAGRPCAVVGTLGMGQPGETLVPTGLTTPDPVMLQSCLRSMVDDGIRACAIEASSIGLVEGRLNATRIKVAVFTNFTQDHLDFHGSMSGYWAAKAMLFDWPGLEHAVVNRDDAKGAALSSSLAERGVDVWSFGTEPAMDREGTPPPRLLARDIGLTDNGMRWQVEERDGEGRVLGSHALSLPVVGHYNVSNLLAVLASVRALGVPLASAVRACKALTPVPGRMEQVGVADEQPLVLVDYAHTPDALEKALQALRPLVGQRGGALWVVVGCGGDRDAGKRPIMAAVAERDAHHAVFTSDNPRSEDPLLILGQMVAGVAHPERVMVEPDRALAIARAVHSADARDVVLVAGKGHEDYQEVQGVKRPFSDLVQARAALSLRGVAPGAAA
jgi:UDP-N-acetylmuramoyl-L-alanyl-D-glutamate--2,6-diaminopimelate ligase